MTPKGILLGLLLIVTVPQRSHNQFTPTSLSSEGCRLESSRGKNPCIGHIRCVSSINSFYSIINNWDCIRTYNNYYGDYSRRSDNYKLHVFFEDIKGDIGWSSIESYKDKIYNFYSTGGDQTSMPNVISYMQYIEEFELTNNKIQEFTIKDFLNKHQMTKLNLSHNAITSIEGDKSDTVQRALSTLDLSYNLIEELPNKVFTCFASLENLDLSHNNIKSMDISTFEGMTQLNKLDVSYNKLTVIGHSFIPFVNLKFLSLKHNQIKELVASNLISMVKLEELNLCCNNIENIETASFSSLSRLSTLDISHNQINIIKENLFQNTTVLSTLLLSDNNIAIIESGAFARCNITNFTIENNRITGTITKNTFAGLKVTNLTLSGGKIQSLADGAFGTFSENLIFLNLSTNFISNISVSAFKSLSSLSILDLSNNNIKELNFDASDLTKLSLFYARNNSITKILKSVFDRLLWLEELDLSHNVINKIESSAFDSLSKLKKLILNDNAFVNAIDANAFQRLVGVNRLDFTNTQITTYKNETFSNMTSLTIFISSHGQLSNVAYNAFLGTGSIISLDLSYNLLEIFSINTTTINRVKIMYLNNNRLTNITNSTFSGLKSLQILKLSSNNILHVEPYSFQSLSSLISIHLTSNLDMELPSNTFDNLVWLEEVNLCNIRKKFNFMNATNSSMSKLLLSRHDFDNINDIFVFHIKNLNKLDLSWNKITYVDKFSFQVMNSLTYLDLSNNLITDIQPGSFSHMHMISDLNLHANDIQSFQYGVLDGLKNLRILNLSDNALHTFQSNVLHSTPLLESLSLDNNVIKLLNFNSFIKTNIKLMYVGGNAILCSTLVDLKSNAYILFTVTAEKLDYGTENVNGVTCRTTVKDIINDVYNNSGGNITWMFRELAKTVVDLQETMKTISNDTAQKENILSNTLSDVAKAVDVLATAYNKSQIASEKNLNTFVRMIDDLEYKNRNSTPINTTNTDDLEKERNMVLRGTLKEMFHNFQHDGREHSESYKDIRVLLYIIAVSLVLSLVLVMGYVLYVYVLKNTKKRVFSSQCTQPIANVIEMD